jgi:hypothetical protein
VHRVRWVLGVLRVHPNLENSENLPNPENPANLPNLENLKDPASENAAVVVVDAGPTARRRE